MFYCLLMNTSAYTALQEEVDRFYPSDEDVYNPKHHLDLRYLTAVMYVNVA